MARHQLAQRDERKAQGSFCCSPRAQRIRDKGQQHLGLDHFEGRSWHGLQRHALMTMIAYAFLQYRRLKTARREKRNNGPPPQPTLSAVSMIKRQGNARPVTLPCIIGGASG